jgi:glutathione S-transferase
MTVQIYGPSMSRIPRITWCAKELGIPFETVDVPWEKLKEPAFLAINPNGKSPALVDGNLKLFESLAINLYLAKKYGTGELYPTNIDDEARVLQWTLWAASELEHLVLPLALVKLGISKDVAGAQAGAERAKPALKVLDGHLKGRQWIVGDRFSVADLNVANVIGTGRFGGLDVSLYPSLMAWHDRCLARPARN